MIGNLFLANVGDGGEGAEGVAMKARVWGGFGLGCQAGYWTSSATRLHSRSQTTLQVCIIGVVG